MGQAGWGWAPLRHGGARPAGRGALGRGAEGLAAPAGMGGCRRCRRRPLPSRCSPRRRAPGSRDMLGPDAEQRQGQSDYADAACAAFAPRALRGRPAHGARRGRHRHRQDARLCRARQPVGRAATAARSGSAPSPAICSARSRASSPACTRNPPSAAAASCCARGGRTTFACSTTRTRCRPRSAAWGRRDR